MKKHGNISLVKQALTQDIFHILKDVPIQSPVNTTQSIITMLSQTDTKDTTQRIKEIISCALPDPDPDNDKQYTIAQVVGVVSYHLKPEICTKSNNDV